MNVLFFSQEFPPQPSGIASYYQQMGESLMQLGHRVVVVTARRPGLPEMEDTPCGRVYRVYDTSECRSLAVRDRVLDIARTHGIDWIEGADYWGEPAQLLAVRERPPVLVKVHGSNPIRVAQEADILWGWQRLTVGLALLRQREKVRAERRSIEDADCLTTPSARMLDELRKQGLRLPRRVAVIPNAIRLPPEPIECSESPTPTALFPARLQILKGVQYIPKIVERTAQRFPDFTLEIAGDDCYARGLGSIRAWLEHELGPLVRHVKFLGRLTAQDMDRAYRRAWATILPSRWDTFPMTVLEAMARGRAVVTTPHGGMPEMLEGTTCAIARPESAEFSERLCGFLGDVTLRREAGASARRKIERCYTPAVVVGTYCEFLSGGR